MFYPFDIGSELILSVKNKNKALGGKFVAGRCSICGALCGPNELCSDCADKADTIAKIDKVLSDLSPEYRKYLAKKAAGIAGIAGVAGSWAISTALVIAISVAFPPALVPSMGVMSRIFGKSTQPLREASTQWARIEKNGKVTDVADLMKVRKSIQKELNDKYNAYHEVSRTQALLDRGKEILKKYGR